MVHAYKNNGYNIVLDVNSGSVHVVDDVVFDLVKVVEEKLCGKYGTAAAADPRWRCRPRRTLRTRRPAGSPARPAGSRCHICPCRIRS